MRNDRKGGVDGRGIEEDCEMWRNEEESVLRMILRFEPGQSGQYCVTDRNRGLKEGHV